MTKREPVSELDLLAYADGLLDHDPGRKARVEMYFRNVPDAAARVEAYREQACALRTAYGARAEEPVPPHLLDTLTARPRTQRVSSLRAAAMVAVCVAAGLAGWVLGQNSARGPEPGQEPLSAVLRGMAAGDGGAEQASASAVAPGGELRWRAQGVRLSFHVPDLGALGYSLTARRNISQDGAQAVALTYEAADGATVRLFIAPKAMPRGEAVTVEREDGASVAYWGHGPLVLAAVADRSGQDIRQLAQRIRDVLHDMSKDPPEQQRHAPDLPMPPSGRLEVTADAASPQTPDALDTQLGRAPRTVDKRIE